MLEEIKSPILKLPDVAQDTPAHFGELAWVGMQGIEIPVTYITPQGERYRIPARADAFVSLDQPQARGIHMSRLFKTLQDGLGQQSLDGKLMLKLVGQFLESQSQLSQTAKLSIYFEVPVQREALISRNLGWRNYPVWIAAEQTVGQPPKIFLQTLVTYSSTCPASAALARQLIQENFRKSFDESLVEAGDIYQWLGSTEGIRATPHAQRSVAKVCVQLKPQANMDFIELIEVIEDALKTPVQTVVKREDEQEFALRNGQNLMFCEDAARRVQTELKSHADIESFWGEMRHIESLHPHDAVSQFGSSKPLQFL